MCANIILYIRSQYIFVYYMKCRQLNPGEKNMGKIKDLEHLEQVQLMEWADHPATREKLPELELLHAIPNGGKRDPRTAMKLKNEGVKRGVPDLHLPVVRNGCPGLYIEMKAGKGRTSSDQDRMHKLLKQQGHIVAVCYSFKAAQSVIVDYLHGNFIK